MNEVIHIFFVDFRFLQKKREGFGEAKYPLFPSEIWMHLLAYKILSNAFWIFDDL
jgi:hypothetical protein